MEKWMTESLSPQEHNAWEKMNLLTGKLLRNESYAGREVLNARYHAEWMALRKAILSSAGELASSLCSGWTCGEKHNTAVSVSQRMLDGKIQDILLNKHDCNAALSLMWDARFAAMAETALAMPA